MEDSKPLQDGRILDMSVIQYVQTMLHLIEEEGGEYQEGREVLEKLKQYVQMSYDANTEGSSDASVVEQLRVIQTQLARVEARVETMSAESLSIVSSSFDASAAVCDRCEE